jgi:outer membrane protein assembly factor BamB
MNQHEMRVKKKRFPIRSPKKRKHPMRRLALWVMVGLMVWAGVELACPAVTRAGDWPGWRGPTGCGTTDEKNLVLNWDGKSGEGIAWKAPLAGTTGHSSPIVWGDRVFITTAVKQTPEQEDKKEIPDHHFACYQASDGKLLWQSRVAHGPFPAYMGVYAAPTPVTDGKAVYCWFGSAVVAAVDFGGNLLWRHELAGDFLKKPFYLNPGICASMVLYKDTVILLFEQGGGAGTLQALDKRTGKVKWERTRDKDKCTQCNTTPLLIDVQGRPQLVILASQMLQSLNPADGEPIWWCTAARGFDSSPLYSSGLVYADIGNDKPALAIDPTGKGDVTTTHVKWRLPEVAGDWASAVADGEYVYKVDESRAVTCRKLATGETVYTEPLQDVSSLASPIATADGRIYFVSAGKSYVIKAGPKFEVLGGGNVGGWDIGSSPAVSGGRIFVRDNDFLYCIGKK